MNVPFLDLPAMHEQVADELRAAFEEVLGSGAFIGGPCVERFEEAWAARCQRRHAVGVANGTDALVLALRALGVGPGDEVIVPANTFVATAEAVVAAGARPRFVDVDEQTLLVTPELVEAAVTPSTAAVMAVHLYGQPVDMDGLLAVTGPAGLTVIEDAAQAHGATWNGRPAGSFGDAACFSFYPGKNLGALGDAGAVVTDDDAVAATIRSLGDHGRAADAKHRHELLGVNSRLDGLQAAFLHAKLAHLDAWTAGRQAAAERYDELLDGLPVTPVAVQPGAASARHLYVVRTEARDEVRAQLERHGIATGIHYPVPCHRQPAFASFADGSLPVAEATAGQILSLPMFPTLSPDQVAAVCDALAEAVAAVGARAPAFVGGG